MCWDRYGNNEMLVFFRSVHGYWADSISYLVTIHTHTNTCILKHIKIPWNILERAGFRRQPINKMWIIQVSMVIKRIHAVMCITVRRNNIFNPVSIGNIVLLQVNPYIRVVVWRKPEWLIIIKRRHHSIPIVDVISVFTHTDTHVRSHARVYTYTRARTRMRTHKHSNIHEQWRIYWLQDLPRVEEKKNSVVQ